MKFGEKLRKQRKKREVSQEELASAVDVTVRTLRNYEAGKSHPQNREVYFRLADYFGVNVNYFLTQDEEFLTAAAESFGQRGQLHAKQILEQTAALFAGGELSESDQLAFQLDMQKLFFEAKEMAKQKYTPRKYRNSGRDVRPEA